MSFMNFFSYMHQQSEMLILSSIARQFVYRIKMNIDEKYNEIIKNYIIITGDKNIDESKFLDFVTNILSTLPKMELYQLPESTIAIITESYYRHKRSNPNMNDKNIFKLIDKSRNKKYLRNFIDKELTLENYILHVLFAEDENGVMPKEDLDLIKYEIKIACDFNNDQKARYKLLYGE